MDGADNVYIGEGHNAIKEWNATTGTVRTLVSSGLNGPEGVAVDTSGNVYIADTWDGDIKEQPRALVPGGPVFEGAAAGSGQLLPVLPTTEVMTGLRPQ